MKRWMWITGAAVAVVAVAAFAVFRPDKLFVDDVVDEQLDADVAAALEEPASTTTSIPAAPPTTAAGPQVVARGEWTSLNDYSVAGSVAVVEEDGRSTIVLSELMSDNGPDLRVYLAPAGPDAGGDITDGIDLGPLKGNIGTQSYELPDGVDPSAFGSVVIWCERFSVGFGVAGLSPA